jgi:hypothetical protein
METKVDAVATNSSCRLCFPGVTLSSVWIADCIPAPFQLIQFDGEALTTMPTWKRRFECRSV